MKKDTIRLLIVALVALIAYNFAVFMIPCYKTTTFWISWVYSLVSFAVGGYGIYTGLIKNTDAKSRFYGFPIARIGVIYLVAQVAVGGVFMALGHILPWWAATVLFTIGLALAVIGLISAETVVEQIQKQDDTLKQKVSVMRSLQSKVGPLASRCDDAAAASAIKAFAEEMRFSDPVSSEAIADADAELSAAIDALQEAVTEGNPAAILDCCRKASAALAERNRLCKLNK